MLDIKRIDHISQVVDHPEPVIALYCNLFGFQRAGDWTEEQEGYRGTNFRVPGTSGIGWELLAPTRLDSFVQRFLESPLGPGLHHVAMQVDSVGEAVQGAAGRSHRALGRAGRRQQRLARGVHPPA